MRRTPRLKQRIRRWVDYDHTGILTLRINLRALLRPMCWVLREHVWKGVLSGTWADPSFSYCRVCGKREY